MKMSIGDLPKQRREEVIVLEILRRNFREQKQSTNKSVGVVLEIPVGDVDFHDSENLSPQKFCRVVYSYKEKGIAVRQLDEGDVQSEISRSHFPDQVAFCTVTVPSDFEELCKTLLREAYSEAADNPSNDVRWRVKFDQSKGVLRYGDIQHGFHKGDKDEKDRLVLFKVLWNNRRHSRGKTIVEGKKAQRAHVATVLNIAEDASNFNRDPVAKTKLKNLISGINRELRAKKIPAKIDTKGGIQLVVQEK